MSNGRAVSGRADKRNWREEETGERAVWLPSQGIPWSGVIVREFEIVKLLPAMPRIVLAILGFGRSGDADGLDRLLTIPRPGRIGVRDTGGGRDSSMISARQEVSDSLAWWGHEAFTKILSRGIGFGSDSLWLRREEGGAQ